MRRLLLLGLVLFCMVGVVAAYSVNQQMELSLQLQYFDGVSVQNVTSSACILSIYNQFTHLPVFTNQPMVGGDLQYYYFTPSQAGQYTASFICIYNNESAVYSQDFLVSQVTPSVTQGLAGGTIAAPITGQVVVSPSNVSAPVPLTPQSALGQFYLGIFWFTVVYFLLLFLLLLIVGAGAKDSSPVVVTFLIGMLLYIAIVVFGYFNISSIIRFLKV